MIALRITATAVMATLATTTAAIAPTLSAGDTIGVVVGATVVRAVGGHGAMRLLQTVLQTLKDGRGHNRFMTQAESNMNKNKHPNIKLKTVHCIDESLHTPWPGINSVKTLVSPIALHTKLSFLYTILFREFLTIM